MKPEHNITLGRRLILAGFTTFLFVSATGCSETSSGDMPETPAARQPPPSFYLGGIQVNEADHEGWFDALEAQSMNTVQVTDTATLAAAIDKARQISFNEETLKDRAHSFSTVRFTERVRSFLSRYVPIDAPTGASTCGTQSEVIHP